MLNEGVNLSLVEQFQLECLSVILKIQICSIFKERGKIKDAELEYVIVELEFA